MKINAIKANGKDYDIWATSAEVEALNNQGNAALGQEISSGKQYIVDAINAKGVPATADESLSELAKKVSEIDWNPNVGFKFMDGYEPKTLVDWFINARNYLLEIDDDKITNNLPIGAFISCSQLSSVILRKFNATLNVTYSQAIFNGNSNLRYVHLPLVGAINNGQSWDGSGQPSVQVLYNITLDCPNCTSFESTLLGRSNNNIFSNLIFGKLAKFSISSPYSQFLLRNITVGAETGINLAFELWDARTVIAEGQSGIDELNSNIQNNLIANLYDYSSGTAHTITLSAGLKAVLTQETIDMANAKGWNIL